MSRGRQNTKPQCQVIPDKYGVSKERIDEYDLQSVIKALDGVKGRAHNIGLALRMKSATIDQIKKVHGSATDRCAISIMDTWLRQDYMKNGPPYNLHEEQYQCPSWWNLVWAVARETGGQNPAHAEKIAKEYRDPDYNQPEDTSAFSTASSEPFGEETTASDLTQELKDVWHRWYEIGVALRIPTHELDAICLSKDSVTDYFQKMIEKWLELGHGKKPSEKPCWKLLLIAVAASYGGHNPGFAQYLLDSHTTISGDDGAESQPRKKQKITDDGMFDLLHVRECKQEIKDLFLPYTINKKVEEKHGLALIIVNETFRHHPEHPEAKVLSPRDCADRDLGRLNKLWRSLGYRVRVERDQTAEQIKSLFDSIQAEGDAQNTIQQEDDSFVCCISSHGNWDPAQGTDVVYGVEGVRLEEEGHIVVKGAVDIKALAYEKLSPLRDGCPKLKGRPKLFFTQACRGEDYGRIVDDGTMGTGKVFMPPRRLPRETDFLFAYATAPGNKAYRNPSDGEPDRPFGSFFITYLCQYLEEYAHKLPLVPILEAVSQKQTALEEPYDVKKKDGNTVTTRQSPNFSSSLRGPVFFFNDARKRYKKRMLFDL